MLAQNVASVQQVSTVLADDFHLPLVVSIDSLFPVLLQLLLVEAQYL
jgi:hypothetical protein